ncbi:MAG: ABC transporter substrate-binding protein [Oligoflexales bacterium]
MRILSKPRTFFILCFFFSYSLFAQAYVIGISQIAPHPSLDEIRQGLIKGLKDAGFSKDIKFRYHNAQGDWGTSAQIARQLVGEGVDVLVGITTPSAQHLLATKSNIPLVFTGVNDPIGARLVKNLEKPGGRVTGVMLYSPVEEQLALIKRMKPRVERVGLIYNSGEDNSIHIMKDFKSKASSLSLKPVVVSINNSAQIAAATHSMVGKVDAIYLPTDNTVISALGAVLQVGKQANIPVFSADLESVEKGAIAALGLDHHQLGVLTANMVAKILRGEKARDIPIAIPSENLLYINLSHASDAMGLNIPVSTLKKAAKLIR